MMVQTSSRRRRSWSSRRRNGGAGLLGRRHNTGGAQLEDSHWGVRAVITWTRLARDPTMPGRLVIVGAPDITTSQAIRRRRGRRHGVKNVAGQTNAVRTEIHQFLDGIGFWGTWRTAFLADGLVDLARNRPDDSTTTGARGYRGGKRGDGISSITARRQRGRHSSAPTTARPYH